MPFNKNLCRAIAESGFPFEDVAIFAGMLSNNLVHMVKNGTEPDESLKGRIADILGKPANQLWPEKTEK